MAADMMCVLTETAPSVSLAPLASPNASAAVLLSPTTWASRPMSRPSRSRELEMSYATMSTQATTTDVVLVDDTDRGQLFRQREVPEPLLNAGHRVRP